MCPVGTGGYIYIYIYIYIYTPRPWAPFARFVLWGSVNHGGTTTHGPRKGDNVGGAECIASRRLRAAGRKLHTRYCRMAHLLRWVSPQLSVKYSSRHLPLRKSDCIYLVAYGEGWARGSGGIADHARYHLKEVPGGALFWEFLLV